MSRPGTCIAAPGTAGRLDRSAALAAGLPAVFAGTAFDPADPVLAGGLQRAGGVGAAHRRAARADAAGDLLVGGDLPCQRGTGDQHLRLEPVGGHRAEVTSARGGVLVR